MMGSNGWGKPKVSKSSSNVGMLLGTEGDDPSGKVVAVERHAAHSHEIDVGEEARVVDDLVVEDSPASPNHGLAVVPDVPGEAQSRGDVVLVVLG